MTIQFRGYINIFWGGGQREGYGGRIWPKKSKMALISEYLAADLSANALCIIDIGNTNSFKMIGVLTSS